MSPVEIGRFRMVAAGFPVPFESSAVSVAFTSFAVLAYATNSVQRADFDLFRCSLPASFGNPLYW
jgi:hypothetical protein